MTTRRTFLIGAGSIIAAPAVVKAENLMKVYSLPERYATVWGVGHDLEVIEHVVWSRADALLFAKGPLYKFREVTDVIYDFDMLPLPASAQSHWTRRESVLKAPVFLDNKTVVQENGFTNVVTLSEQGKWRESLRPDLGSRRSVEWIQNEIGLRAEAELGPLAWYPGAGLVKVPVT